MLPKVSTKSRNRYKPLLLVVPLCIFVFAVVVFSPPSPGATISVPKQNANEIPEPDLDSLQALWKQHQAEEQGQEHAAAGIGRRSKRQAFDATCKEPSLPYDKVLEAAIADAEAYAKANGARVAQHPQLKGIEGVEDAYVRAFMTTIQTCVEYRKDATTYVRTGDLDYMWLRDSAAQVRPYLTLARTSDAMRMIIEGTILKMAELELYDPYANSYRKFAWWNSDLEPTRLGRGGHTATRNYELDSACYMVWLAHSYWKATGNTCHFDEVFLLAVRRMISTWRTEQHHEPGEWGRSTYLYGELPNDGKGTPVKYTGMTWVPFRPSDDQTKYGYLVPANIMAVATLERLSEIMTSVYTDVELWPEEEPLEFAKEIADGILKHALLDSGKKGEKMFAYEVDGMGNHHNMDDANIPSLLSIPYLLEGVNDRYGFLDHYEQTREWVLSSKNPYYNKNNDGSIAGIGSPHSHAHYVWPLGIVMEGMTTDDDAAKARLVRMLVDTSKQQTRGRGGGAMFSVLHESFSVSTPSQFTRPHFAWVDSLFAEWIERDFLQ